MKFTVNLDEGGYVQKIHAENPQNECNTEAYKSDDIKEWPLADVLEIGTKGLWRNGTLRDLLCGHCFGGDE